MLGRRGPAQAAFTSAELRELGHLDGVDLRVDAADLALDPVSRRWLDEEGTFTARRTSSCCVSSPRAPRGPAPAGGSCCASCAPPPRSAEPAASRRSTSVRNRIAWPEGCPAGGAVGGAGRDVECGLVLRSVGYRAVPLPDVPFDERNYVLPNERGRVRAGR